LPVYGSGENLAAAANLRYTAYEVYRDAFAHWPRTKGRKHERGRQAGHPGAIARYSHAYDSKDADAFAQLFVENGIFEVIARESPPGRQPDLGLASPGTITSKIPFSTKSCANASASLLS